MITHIMQSISCEIPGWMKHKMESRLQGEISITSIISITLPLWQKVKEESEKVDIKLNIQKTKIMASGPITSWQIDGETMKTVRNFMPGKCKFLFNHL